MAIRLQRVLIACGLPAIIAIVSFYWLRKRRKAVIHSSSPKQSPKECANNSSIDLGTERSKFDLIDRVESRVETIGKSKPIPIRSPNNCESFRLHSQYEHRMQLRDNNKANSGGATDAMASACDASTRQQFISDNNNTTNAMTSADNTDNETENNNSNHSLGFKRQMNCENNGNEYNNCNENELNRKYSNISVDKIVVKLSNFSLNNSDNKGIEKSNDLEMNANNEETNICLTQRDSNCDNQSSNAEKDSVGQQNGSNKRSKSASNELIETNVGSHNDNNDNNCKESIDTNDCKSITNNALIDGTRSHTNSDSNQVLESDVIDAQKQNNCNSTQIAIKVNNNCVHNLNSDGPHLMSQTGSIDNNTSSACSSSASCLMTNGYDNGDIYHNYPDSVGAIDQSPPHSAFSDVQSEGSSDSGKGGSDILHATTPIDTQRLNAANETVIYQFEIPQYLCGRLIGCSGHFVSSIKRTTNTSVVINRHIHSSDMKICTLTGTKPAIKEALNQIRYRFPVTDYPNVTLQQINLLNATQTCAVPQTCQLQLPSGISCDVILSSLVSAGHFFLQQPTHPTYPSLSRLDNYMIQTYSQQNTPLLPNSHTGMICAVPIMGGWYRAVITKVYDTEECDVMFVDYGGYSRLPVSSLRQIRYDFMSLPFQASECYLANIEPIDPAIGWTAEANALFEELAQGQILQALIVGYSENGIPLVNLFKVQGISNVFINQELVNRSHAQWAVSSA